MTVTLRQRNTKRVPRSYHGGVNSLPFLFSNRLIGLKPDVIIQTFNVPTLTPPHQTASPPPPFFFPRGMGRRAGGVRNLKVFRHARLFDSWH